MAIEGDKIMTLIDFLIIIGITWFCVVPLALIIITGDLIRDWVEVLLREREKKYDD